MITLHHLNASRSLRILWLLEEIGEPYTLIRYQRDPATRLAPASLKNIHPLGKSPVIELDGQVLVESGAIVEYLIRRFAPQLEPAFNSPDYLQYLQWIHFAESSAMVPVLLKLFTQFEINAGTQLKFLDGYTQTEFDKVLGYLDSVLANRTFIVGDTLSGADFMLAFVAITVVEQMKSGAQYPHLQAYLQRLAELDSWKRALKLESELDE
ncbi:MULTISPECIES: glutathione S-transferase family protein [Pseudomonas]|jgi:glutathione S-transferase|uniref:Glutathione S-transferase n=2 Tax=Pseudomonas psychrophila TaxID=122355 RepID=A0ABY0VXH3_9PSED|nr:MULTISPECIES: glutathione S-transferase [Pseudomonas]KAB0492359.1 glutathione S-transferase [Pseudomonas psychrophila]KMM98538.1 glutathione S-transferase [Pseudomonas psychrophila]KOX64920.1 glutathione S-transferase [Pseudomonas psychrophila]MDY7580510.1 glutathione S-transferase [Pseudomonas sp. CCI3.1]MEB0066166.1 glutathione S-transferase [Pseudomonas sp. CCI3.1]